MKPKLDTKNHFAWFSKHAYGNSEETTQTKTPTISKHKETFLELTTGGKIHHLFLDKSYPLQLAGRFKRVAIAPHTKSQSRISEIIAAETTIGYNSFGSEPAIHAIAKDGEVYAYLIEHGFEEQNYRVVLLDEDFTCLHLWDSER